MPELPEVQSTVDYLKERICNVRIEKVQVHWHRSFASHPSRDPSKLIEGLQVADVYRRGKFIAICLKAKKNSREPILLLVHLRMSGSLEVIDSKRALDPYDRIVLKLSNGKDLRFNDVRKFGRMYVSEGPHSMLDALGIEPLIPEFTSDQLLRMLSNRKRTIKPLLLDQSFIAGIGNIYADESLWLAGIHPTRSAHSLKPHEVHGLHSAIQSVLNEAIKMKGTDNGDEVVAGGLYETKVYARESEPCPRCSSAIVRIVVGQRGTHFCSHCQPSSISQPSSVSQPSRVSQSRKTSQPRKASQPRKTPLPKRTQRPKARRHKLAS